MTSVLLIYPYFRPKHDRSTFRFPPLGLGYIASSLRSVGCSPELLDCTFLDKDDALKRALDADADIVGIYSMVTMREESLRFARHLRGRSSLLIAGGPLPSSDPGVFLSDFDVVVVGEGEQAAAEILKAYESGSDLRSIKGIAYRQDGRVVLTPKRELENDLDKIAFPARDLFPNQMYIDHWKKRFGYSTTTVITTRGCPFSCEFCSNAVFGVSYRERSQKNVLDEVEEALSFGYDRIHFADDVFTLNRKRLLHLCDEIISRELDFPWECLGRVDSIDRATAEAMKRAGCRRIFFGIESGDDSVLRLMNKKITTSDARRAVEAAQSSGLKTGAFFILCYPGETDDTVLKTIKFATSLPVDYLSFTMPYPLPGTALYERVKDRIAMDWKEPDSPFCDHVLVFKADFSEAKMKFAIFKGQVQFMMQKELGPRAPLLQRPFEMLTDEVFRLMK
ncbi:MAG TPA: radical SAM protein [Methanotrichaceae archaeon]|nr:radical SAM protein [Methanotrichaceae archaeon]